MPGDGNNGTGQLPSQQAVGGKHWLLEFGIGETAQGLGQLPLWI